MTARVWALILCLASLPLTYPVVLFMVIVLGQQARTMMFFIGPASHSSCAVAMQKWKAKAEKEKEDKAGFRTE